MIMVTSSLYAELNVPATTWHPIFVMIPALSLTRPMCPSGISMASPVLISFCSIDAILVVSTARRSKHTSDSKAYSGVYASSFIFFTFSLFIVFLCLFRVYIKIVVYKSKGQSLNLALIIKFFLVLENSVSVLLLRYFYK